MLEYPVIFRTEAESAAGVSVPWPIRSEQGFGSCAVPPEFGGGGGAFSPEDLFAQALSNCFLATFQVYANASKLNFSNVLVSAQLTVDRNENKQPVMKECHLEIQIIGAERPDRMTSLVEKAMRSGFILNSVKTQISWNLTLA